MISHVRHAEAGRAPAGNRDSDGRLASGVIIQILAELERTTLCQPHWPDDPVHAAAHLGEECGELTRAALDYMYEDGERERLAEEAVRCGALAIRFLENFWRYTKRSDQ